MLRILHGTSYDFIRLRRWTYGLSALFIIPGLLWILIGGFRYSVEFTGGTLIQLVFKQTPNVGEIRSTLDAAGIRGAEVQQFGNEREYVIRAQDRAHIEQQAQSASNVATQITGALRAKYGAEGFTVARVEAVGPKVGGELRTKALYAVLISFLVTLAYLAWRFEWRFGVAAVIATAHDILATLAFIKYLDLEVSLVVVGAILTMIGYSLNDTIIIFDRVRENLRKRRKESVYAVLNRSVNETLPRSILTHSTTFATLLALTFLGGEVIRPFALVMLFGVVTGTFSSVYVAAPVLLWIEERWPRAGSDRSGAGPRQRGDAGARGTARGEKDKGPPAPAAAASTRR